MSSIKDRLNEPASQRPNLGGELRRMRENGQASAEEIRDFLKSVRGKSPQDVLGVVAQSGLVMSIVWATIGFAVLLVASSVVFYYWNQPSPQAKAATPPAEEKTQNENQASSTDDATEPDKQASSTDAAKPEPQSENPDKPAGDLPDKLGIGETKAADPEKNPLDSDFDNLLDGVD